MASSVQDSTLDRAVHFVDKSYLARLSALEPRKSLGQLLLQWTSVAAAIYFSNPIIFGPSETGALAIVVYMLVVVWIGTRQHALAVLLHEAVHYRLCHKRKLNDFIGEWLIAWPLQTSLLGYRRQHYAHHSRTGMMDDPDFARIRGVGKYQFPKTPRQILWISVKYLFGYYAIHDGKEAMEQLVIKIPLSLHLKRFLLYALLIAAAVHYDFWLELIAYWLVPTCTVFFLVLYIRLVGEHCAIPGGESIFALTRHVEATWWERHLIAPLGVNYHLDHHIYPHVPFYNLPKLHQLLLQNERYRKGARLNHKGYIRGVLLDECVNYRST